MQGPAPGPGDRKRAGRAFPLPSPRGWETKPRNLRVLSAPPPAAPPPPPAPEPRASRDGADPSPGSFAAALRASGGGLRHGEHVPKRRGARGGPPGAAPPPRPPGLVAVLHAVRQRLLPGLPGARLLRQVQGSQSPRRLQRGAQLRLHRQVPEHHGPAAQHLPHHPHRRPDRERHHHHSQPAQPPAAAAGQPPLPRPHLAPSPAPGVELGPLQPPPPLGAGLRSPRSPSGACWGLALLSLLLQVPLTTTQSAS